LSYIRRGIAEESAQTDHVRQNPQLSSGTVSRGGSNPEVLTYDWMKSGGRSLLINAVTGKVGTGTNMSGYPTNRPLTARGDP
jgi:hypothetical protein